MRILGGLLILMLLHCSSNAQQSQSISDPIFRVAAGRLSSLLNSIEGEYHLWFTDEFFKQVPREKLVDGMKERSKVLGPIQRVRLCRMTSPNSAELEFISKSGKRVRASVRVEAQYPNRFEYLMFSDIDMGDDTWEKLNVDIQRLPGDHAVSIWKLTPSRLKLFSRNSGDPLAVGSSFKLLVLSLLAEEIAAGSRHWKDVVPLREEGRSLPSGMLQDWPVGSPITLHTLATMMISRSDNTAADHLMLLLGRENLEQHQTKMHVQFPERNRPFLRTSELFKLKLVIHPMEASTYGHRTDEEKQKFLAQFDKYKLVNPRMPALPVHIDQIEWFYCTDDLTRILESLRLSKEASTVLPMLAVSKPFDLDEFAWDYLGFKGGAEAGVLNLSMMGRLRSTQEWFVMSFTWNRTDRVLDEPAWLRIAQRSLLLIERGK